MTRKVADSCDVIKKSEALRILGFGATSGYRYLTFLDKNKVLCPVLLPGIKGARYLRKEVVALANNKDPEKYSHISEFKTHTQI